ncbi:MAG: hypothetical protein PHR69_09765 [Sphaerochaeta sp.]|nr:hypothetical protein [Sphaerochaeta sp.]
MKLMTRAKGDADIPIRMTAKHLMSIQAVWCNLRVMIARMLPTMIWISLFP